MHSRIRVTPLSALAVFSGTRGHSFSFRSQSLLGGFAFHYIIYYMRRKVNLYFENILLCDGEVAQGVAPNPTQGFALRTHRLWKSTNPKRQPGIKVFARLFSKSRVPPTQKSTPQAIDPRRAVMFAFSLKVLQSRCFCTIRGCRGPEASGDLP